jgi:hypothetical protein
MAETVIIALEGAYDRVSLGEGTRAENIDFFVRKAEELGFEVVDRGTSATEPVVGVTAPPTAGREPLGGVGAPASDSAAVVSARIGDE